MGIHEFGKRTTSGRPPIPRPVPTIVTETEWKKAQANLKANMLFSARGAKNKYLLRGLIKCGLCGLTYVGVVGNRNTRKATRESYYRCNGMAFAAFIALFTSVAVPLYMAVSMVCACVVVLNRVLRLHGGVGTEY
jgi:hypothetical protein